MHILYTKKVQICMTECILIFIKAASLSLSCSVSMSLTSKCKADCQNVSTLVAAMPGWITQNRTRAVVVHCPCPVSGLITSFSPFIFNCACETNHTVISQLKHYVVKDNTENADLLFLSPLFVMVVLTSSFH